MSWNKLFDSISSWSTSRGSLELGPLSSSEVFKDSGRDDLYIWALVDYYSEFKFCSRYC